MCGLTQPEKKISIHLFCVNLINAVAIQECLCLRRDQITTGDQVPLRTVKRVENGVRVLESESEYRIRAVGMTIGVD